MKVFNLSWFWFKQIRNAEMVVLPLVMTFLLFFVILKTMYNIMENLSVVFGG